MRQLGGIYEDTRGRIGELVGALDDEAASALVPACPSWSVHDVVAHVTGNCADILAGNIAGAATDEWTTAQVEKRRDIGVEGILSEWDDVGPQIAAMLDDFPGWYGHQVVADLTVHEHDLRGTLKRPGSRDSEAVAIGLDFLVNVILHSGVTALGLEPLQVEANGKSWVVGTGDPATADRESWRAVANTRDRLPDPTSSSAASLVLEPFELFRAATGRRSAKQIRGYDWTVDPDAYLPAFGNGPFTVRPSDLDE